MCFPYEKLQKQIVELIVVANRVASFCCFIVEKYTHQIVELIFAWYFAIPWLTAYRVFASLAIWPCDNRGHRRRHSCTAYRELRTAGAAAAAAAPPAPATAPAPAPTPAPAGAPASAPEPASAPRAAQTRFVQSHCDSDHSAAQTSTYHCTAEQRTAPHGDSDHSTQTSMYQCTHVPACIGTVCDLIENSDFAAPEGRKKSHSES